METQKSQFCEPSGLRIWRGFRSRSFFDDRVGFDKIIASVFVPHTAQQMEPLGLAAYFPALLPDSIPPDCNDRFLKIPDEVALVAYPSKTAYEHAIKDSVAGRAYGLLHWPVFNYNDPEIPPSRSGHPDPFQDALRWDTPYYLVPKAIDWRSGVTRLLIARPAYSLAADDFLMQLEMIVQQWQQTADSNFDGAILCATPNYLLYWEHRQQDTDEGSLMPLLQQITEEPYLCKKATPIIVPPVFQEDDPGVDMEIGDFLDVRVDLYRKR